MDDIRTFRRNPIFVEAMQVPSADQPGKLPDLQAWSGALDVRSLRWDYDVGMYEVGYGFADCTVGGMVDDGSVLVATADGSYAVGSPGDWVVKTAGGGFGVIPDSALKLEFAEVDG